MTVAELIGKLRSKKQTAHRTAFQHYLEAVRELASGSEIDADEVGHVLDAAGKPETDLEADVTLQQQRLAWHAQRVANQQAVTDRLQAERDLREAQAKLQEAYDRLLPAIDLAQSKLADANHRHMTTMQAEQWLADTANILDIELIDRERAVSAKLQTVSEELKPLQQDRVRKQTYLSNLESRLAELRSAASVPWLEPVVRPWLGRVNTDINLIESRISDVRSELQQLDGAIRPRRAEQIRLQRELDSIHTEKLKP